MRILGFTKKWDKLEQAEFTTFRFPRKDADWKVGEQVQIVYKPRSKERVRLGTAEIIGKVAERIFPEPIPDPICPIAAVSEYEAIKDGFPNLREMHLWMWDRYKRRAVNEPMNKLTLKWQSHDISLKILQLYRKQG